MVINPLGGCEHRVSGLEQGAGIRGVLRLEGPPNINGSLGRVAAEVYLWVAVMDVVG